MNCEECRTSTEKFMDLSRGERMALDGHLFKCPDCLNWIKMQCWNYLSSGGVLPADLIIEVVQTLLGDLSDPEYVHPINQGDK